MCVCDMVLFPLANILRQQHVTRALDHVSHYEEVNGGGGELTWVKDFFSNIEIFADNEQ